ncbi:MAG: DNA topoisomerase, partial [Myxococcales bacterium]|nr:DNA topoisomerase [Myxococcales bacterium]
MQMDLFRDDDDGTQGSGGVEVVRLHEAARKRYLNYALSVITSRALPDVRDGLKPVQRRILYGMYKDLRLRHDSRFLKSARVVGDVMGKYHPHGDSSIYDAMVRMAQPFSLRYPLVDGHGNFGSVDGDPAAAMRYTEARLQSIAEELISEIGQRTVDHRPTYDGQLEEPVVLPAQLPNLLINGASGIAVGMATNIPPHNLREVIDALLAMIDDPAIGLAELCRHVRAPDFPLGGEILSTPEELLAMYESGQGPVKLRGAYTEELINRKRHIVVTSIPYGVNKSTLIEKIAQHIVARNVPQIVDVRDESTDDVRIVLELKRGASTEA